jgi:DNA-binding MarR family transcriptional regulator/N-acetylglutamate synthase-like GNAT family acetyltransferase
MHAVGHPNSNQHSVAALRRFNRFYTRQIGLLQEGLLSSPWSLTEVRVLYELAHRQELTATELKSEVGIDAGYLSRILQGFAKRGLILKRTSPADARQSLLKLTRKGHAAFAPLEERANREVAELLERLSPGDQGRLLAATGVIQRMLGAADQDRLAYVLRSHQPGDIGWIIHRHGFLYAKEYGWDERFEALVAELAARFVQNLDPARERCWIAERDGEFLGCVFLVKKSDEVAQLRMLLVEPSARGMGVGKRLVQECIRFSRSAGYKSITLWTNSVLLAARHLYEQAGFRLTSRESQHLFGHALVSETWDLELCPDQETSQLVPAR